MKKSTTKLIFILCGVLLLLCMAGAYVLFSDRVSADGIVEIVSNGVVIETIDLSKLTEPRTIDVRCEDGYNQVYISKNEVRVLQADCDDLTCVKTGVLRENVPLVCLPHKLIVRFAGTSDDALDAVN